MTGGENEKLIQSFEYTLVSPGCHPGADSYTIKQRIDADLSEVLPLLNAEFDGAEYDHKAKVLVWRKGKMKYAFRPQEISISPVRNREDILPLCSEIIDKVNSIWERRGEIEPDFTRLQPPSLMEIYKILPRTNCGECGYPACMAFAAALRENKADAECCPHISADTVPRGTVTS